MSEPAFEYPDELARRTEVTLVATDSIEALRAERARQRLGYVALASSGLRELPELSDEQLDTVDAYLIGIHDLPQVAKDKEPLKRSHQMRMFRDGWSHEEIAEETGGTPDGVKQGRYSFTHSLSKLVTKSQVAVALEKYAKDPERDFSDILPAPEILPRLPRQRNKDRFADLEDLVEPEASPDDTPPADSLFDDEAAAESQEEDDYDYREVGMASPDLVRVYLTDIGRVPLLTAEQEVDLAKGIETGLFAAELLRLHKERANLSDEDLVAYERFKSYISNQHKRTNLESLVADGARSRDHLLEANLRLVVSLAKRYQGRGVPFLDLIQEGNIGLVRAVEKFDYTKGYKFSTYATWWIRQALQRGLADQGRTIRIPVHMVEQINKVSRVKRDLEHDLGRKPTFQEIGDYVDMTAEKVEQVVKYSREPVSIDQPVGEGGKGRGETESYLGDLIEDGDAPITEEVVDFGLLQDRLRSVLAGLHPRSALVMRLRFGMEDGRARTLDEVGRELGLTRERIRQIEKNTLLQLRNDSTAQTLKTWL